ncbi:MAG: hypothetical protein ACJZ63_06145 [Candidatus Poseidoniaceae archaeon]|tara:strand:+ start:4363 stop:4998 length:636 start_codon:yes stop_codon:yes gene_type:complete
MRRRKKGERDEAQASLDAFTQGPKPPAPEPKPAAEPAVPSMPDLDVLAEADERLRQGAPTPPTQEPADAQPLRTFEMPSMSQKAPAQSPTTTTMYHDLGKMYPHPPIAREDGGLVLHRAVLNDLTGCGTLLNWVADGHAVIVEMKRLMKRTVEFNAALSQLNGFIGDDLGGQILQMTSTRLMLLPANCRGVNGIEMEAFAVEPGDFTEVGR